MTIFLILTLFVGQARVVDSVLPSLTYSRTCSTTVEVRNLGDRDVEARVEGHRESGALVGMAGQAGMAIHLGPGERKSFVLNIPEATDSAWALVRELVQGREFSPVLSVGGTTDCVAENRVRSAMREVAHPSVNPWFDGEIDEIRGARLTVVNTSETVAVVTGCYSGGISVANPNVPWGATLMPLCSHQFREQIPPFSARQFPVERQGNTHFSLHAMGRGVALQMMRLLDAGTQLYQVDSSIRFGQ